MNGTQCRMARAGLGLGAQKLADLAEVHYITLRRFEAGGSVADDSREKLEKALLDAGAAFTRRAARVGVTVPEA